MRCRCTCLDRTRRNNEQVIKTKDLRVVFVSSTSMHPGPGPVFGVLALFASIKRCEEDVGWITMALGDLLGEGN